MLSSSAEPSPLIRVISGFFLGLSLLGYVLFVWSLYRLHLPPLAPPACAQTQAQPSRSSVQDELFVAVTSSIGQRRQMCLMDDRGFPRTRAKRQSRVRGFRTGDMVRAVVPAGTKAGTYVGRVAGRTTGQFNVTTTAGHEYSRRLPGLSGARRCRSGFF